MIESGTSQCPRLYNVILAGPNTEKLGPQFQQAMEVGDGAQHREIGTPISTGNGSWRGPNTEKLEPQFQQAMEVGDGAQHRS
ncbi:TPA: hypothetical protein PBS38_000624 [Staphylococcus aureus]|nr:hypothetical protein [Staphylococcus aureus]HDG8371327.1 hypothetical protein [Staphylococcus aureus]